MNPKITVITSEVEKYIKEFEDLRVRTHSDLQDRKNFYAASMVLLAIFTRVIDLGRELVVEKNLGMPATYAETFFILSKRGIISKALLLELREVVRLRNRLSHEYFSFTEQDVLEGIRKIAAIKEFLAVSKKKIR